MFFGSHIVNTSSKCELGMRMKETEAQKQNFVLFEQMFNYYSNLAVTRYEWNGLPDTVSERFLNQVLYLFGYAAFFNDENMGYLALPCTMSGEFNIYYEPTAINAFSFNFNKYLKFNEFVLIRNTPTLTPTALSVFEYCKRMADVIRTIDVLCKKLKQPFIILCDEKKRQTYLNFIKRINDNEPLIIGVKDYEIKSAVFDIKDTRVDTDIVRLWEVYRNYENILYTILGLENISQPKKERLIVDEVNSNNMVTEMSLEINMKSLQTACEQINKKYDLNIKVTAKGVYDYPRSHGTPIEEYDNPEGGDE